MNGLGISCEQDLLSNMTQLLIRGHLGNLITLTTPIVGVIEFMLENCSGPSVTHCSLSEETAHLTVHHHFGQLFVDIQITGRPCAAPSQVLIFFC